MNCLSSPPVVPTPPVRAGNGASDRRSAGHAPDWVAPLERALWHLCGVALLGDFVLGAAVLLNNVAIAHQLAHAVTP